MSDSSGIFTRRSKDFSGLPEVRIGARNIDQPEFGKLSKQRQVVFEVPHEVREDCCAVMNIGERHHGGRNQEHRELIHEIPDRCTSGLAANVESNGEIVLLDIQSPAEEANFILLGFKVFVPLIIENEVEHNDAAFDEVDFMRATVTDVFLFDTAIEPT